MKKYLPIVALAALSLIVYLNALPGRFVWDDEDFVYKNVYVRNFSLFPYSLNQNLIAGAGKISNYYRPLLLLSFSIDWHLWRGSPVGFHLTNIILHAGAAILAFLVLKELRLNKLTAFVAAGFFALHPLQTEAVTYISGRGDSLYSLLLLGSLLLYLKANHTSVSDHRYLASLGLFTAALMAKELAVVGLPLLILLDLVRGQKWPDRPWVQDRVRRLWLYALISGGYLLLRLTALNFADSLNFYGEANLYTQSLVVRLATFAQVLVTYLSLLVFPNNLHMERTTAVIANPFTPLVLIVGLALILASAGSVWLLKKHQPLPILALGWFLINLVPTSGIVPINGIIYEHFLYLALLGPFILVGAAVSQACRLGGKARPCRYLAPATIAVWWVLLGIRTVARNSEWRDPITFYQRLLRYGESARVYNNLGMAHADQGNNEQAINYYQKAIELADVYPQAHHNLANSYQALGRIDEATGAYHRAIEMSPGFAPAYDKLIELYLNKNRLDEAIAVVDQAIKAFPQEQRYQTLRMTLFLRK